MSQISKDFISDLKNADGILHPFLKRLNQDHTLMLAIRNGYINIYYRGGNILQLTEHGKGAYTTFFDKGYDKSRKRISYLPETITCKNAAITWVDKFSLLKEMMDDFFSKIGKSEREFQQLVARENNYSTISNESEYFITDIEINDEELNARFDMLAIRWLAADRKDGRKSRAAFIEMKYGDNSLRGTSGMIKHLQDFNNLISNPDKYKPLLENMESQFNQLDELGLILFKHSKGTKVKLDAKEKPEVIFMLANHNPRSKILSEELNNPEFIKYIDAAHFDLRFFVSSFAGYGLHSNCMFSLTDFLELLKVFKAKQNSARKSSSD
jgi:hypothetical protein